MESLTIKTQRKTRKPKLRVVAEKSVAAVVASIGYILSPASWWNDAVVNIPLALLMARILHPITHLSLPLLFTIAYWATNVIGVLLMAWGGASLAGRGRSWRSVLFSLVVASAYTVVVVSVLNMLSH